MINLDLGNDLKRLIIKNPDLPIIFMNGKKDSFWDYDYLIGERVSADIEEVLVDDECKKYQSGWQKAIVVWID